MVDMLERCKVTKQPTILLTNVMFFIVTKDKTEYPVKPKKIGIIPILKLSSIRFYRLNYHILM